MKHNYFAKFYLSPNIVNEEAMTKKRAEKA